ncbi:MAG TPA: hypothetical protein VG520_09635 [Candidatus Dormibacteraeota bacterium]|nr:hypothetical protein [Candidatus Dormibacteraeota bacterium]
MLSAGLRLVLAVAAPLAAAAAVHELRRRRRLVALIAVLSICACAALTVTVVSGVSGGASVERSFGSAIPGVDLTARADQASVAIILVACVAALLAVPRHRHDGERLAGLLLCLAGAVTVATAGNLVLVAAGVEVIAAGTLLLRGQRGPGSRSSAILAGLLCGAGLALVAAATQLVSAAGSSDLAAVPPGAIGGALAIPWALGGAALLLSPALPGEGGSPARDFAAVGALPAGFLVLLRLQESAGGQLPGNAAVTLAIVGAAVAAVAAYTARRAVTMASAGRSGIAILAGVLVSLFGGPLSTGGTALAGLFLAVELALLAAPSWGRRPSRWSAASMALIALPGGAAFAVVAVGLATAAHRGAAAFPQLLVLSGVVAVGATAAARAVAIPPRPWRPALPGALVAVAAGLGGGLVPGLALRYVAAPLSGGATAVDIDGGALAVPGGGFAGGYFAVAAAVVLITAAAAIVVAGDDYIAEAAPAPHPVSVPPLRLLLRLRRRSRPAARGAATVARRLDHWLESQPQVPLFVVGAALAVLLFH